jgi:hypothetical protein
MVAPWEYRDFDDHEGIHLFRDPAAGLTAAIAFLKLMPRDRRSASVIASEGSS